MQEDELRLKCLELALEYEFMPPLEAAQNFYDFIKGRDGAEITRAVRAASALPEVDNAKQ